MNLKWRIIVEVEDQEGRKRWIEGPQQQCEVNAGITLQRFGEAVNEALMDGLQGGEVHTKARRHEEGR